MPNWCYSTVTIEASRTSLEKVKSEMDIALSSNPLNAGFGNEWLGNLLYHIGVSEEEVDYGNTRCRGSVEDYELEDGAIVLHTESAWRPHIQCIKDFVDHYVDDAKIIYVADEPMLTLHWTNDPEEVDRVYVMHCLSDRPESKEIQNLVDSIQGMKKEEAHQKLSLYLNMDGSFEFLVDKLIEKVIEVNADEYLSIYAYEYVAIDRAKT